MPEREGLIRRLQQLRRVPSETDRPGTPSTSASSRDEVRALEARIAHLEQLLQGLQDSVHRESMRLGKRIGELEARIQPAVLSRTLSDDARERGL